MFDGLKHFRFVFEGIYTMLGSSIQHALWKYHEYLTEVHFIFNQLPPQGNFILDLEKCQTEKGLIQPSSGRLRVFFIYSIMTISSMEKINFILISKEI